MTARRTTSSNGFFPRQRSSVVMQSSTFGTSWPVAVRASLALLLGCGATAAVQAQQVDAYFAATIWPGDGPPLTDAVLVVQDAQVLAVGPRASTPIPDHAIRHELTGQTLIPGLVVVQSAVVESTRESEYALTPEVRAADGFDPFADYQPLLAAGITTLQISPGANRLMPGQGGVVKLAGEDASQQILVESESLRLVLTRDALSPPTIYEPPVGAVSVERPLEPTQPQLATSLAQAIVGLDALFSEAMHGGLADSNLSALTQLLSQGRTFRFTAEQAVEVKAALELAEKFQLRWLIVDPLDTTYLEQADWDNAKAVGVVFNPEFRPGRISNPSVPLPGQRPQVDVWERAQRLVEAGAAHKLALRAASDSDLSSLLFQAALFQRGGLSTEQVLRMLTRNPADMLGVDRRVGSLQPQADADFVVLSGAPFASGTQVMATYVEGSQVYARSAAKSATMIHAAQVYTPRGMITGGVSVQAGKISGVGASLSTPRGASIMHFENGVIVPGLIDFATQLGLGDPLTDQISLDTQLGEFLSRHDRQIERARQGGITSALLSSSRLPSPVLAFKLTDQPRPLMDPVAIRFEISGNLTATEDSLRKTLRTGQAYAAAWKKYEADYAEYERQLKAYEVEKKKYDEAVKAAEAKRAAAEKQAAEADKSSGDSSKNSRPAGEADPPQAKSDDQADEKAGQDDSQPPAADADQSKTPKADAADKSSGGTSGLKEPVKPEEPKKPRQTAALEPYRPLFAKEIAALVEVDETRAVEVALKLFREEFDLRTAILAGEAAVSQRELLAKQDVLVVLGPTLVGQRDGALLNYAAELAVAGVPIAFQSNATTGTGQLPEAVAYAVHEGLGRTDALHAMSDGAAEFLQLNSVGAIEVGRDADLIVLSGPPFEISSQVLAVMIDGQWVYEKESD